MTPKKAITPDVLNLDPKKEADKITATIRKLLSKQLKRRGLVVGLSGGIDSSVTLALSVTAIGAERVLALLMPERHSADETLELSTMVADHFKVKKIHENISGILKAVGFYEKYDNAVRQAIPEYGPDWKSKIVIPNVMETKGFNVFSVVAQAPETTEYDGMPRSAIGTGLVDFELPPAEMPAQLIAYVTHAFGKPHRPTVPAPKSDNAMKKILVLLRAQTGHDFSQYKPSTSQRRIERRMAVHQIETMEDYVKFIQQTPEEVDALFRDILIGVTSFFRDPEAFKALEEQIIPKLFAGKRQDAVIRVWVPGCSTGEEAYSLAILLAERQEMLKQSFKVQVFATDIDSQAIATARAGLYPASIAADLTPVRLARFFSAEPGDSAFRVHKSIRDMLVFSEQNVIKDPPFSKLDLISCRNLLIYLSGDLQKKLIPLFHYALNPGGFLFLGTSETVGEYQDIFTPLDRKLKLYQRKEDLLGGQRPGRFLPPMAGFDAAPPRIAQKTDSPRKLPLRELTEQALLQEIIQAGVLVNAQGDILYLHGRTGMYLEPALERAV